MQKIVFKDGTTFVGVSFGRQKEVIGELVFDTSMSGYQKIINDTRYANKIILFTYPLIGNYGFNNIENDSPVLKAMIIREGCEKPSNFKCEYNLHEYAKIKNFVGIQGVDTRSIARKIRNEGVQPVILCDVNLDNEIAIQKLNNYKAESNLVSSFSVKKPIVIKGSREKVVVIDYGYSEEIVEHLKQKNCHIIILPYDTSISEILSYLPDGVILSDGVGNPNELTHYAKQMKSLFSKTTLLGVNFGCMLLALANHLEIETLKFGHHGQNYPIKNKLNNQVEITNQNNLYTIKPFSDNAFMVSHVSVNDDQIEGIIHQDYDVRGITYLNEAVIDAFINRMRGK